MNDIDLVTLYLNVKRHFSERNFHIAENRFKISNTQKLPKVSGRLRQIFKYVKNNKASFVSFLVANFAYGNGNEIYELGDTAYENYDKWMAYRNSFTYRILQENDFIQQVLAKNKLNFDQLFEKITQNKVPPILQLYMSNKVSIELMCHFERSKKYLTKWMEDDSLMLLYGTEILKIFKTEYFVKRIEKKQTCTGEI